MPDVFQLVGAVLLSDHTAAHADHGVGAGVLYMFRLSDYGERLFFRVLSYGAGVYKYELCFCGVVTRLIAH